LRLIFSTVLVARVLPLLSRGTMPPTGESRPSSHALGDPEARDDASLGLLGRLAGSFRGPPILSPGIDRGEQQIGRARRDADEAGSVAFRGSLACCI
jgi:hypothetical protein